MRPNKFGVLILLIILASGCGKKTPPEPVQTPKAGSEAASNADEEITTQMIGEYAMVHQISDLKTAEFYLKNPDYAKKNPYRPTKEDRTFYERKFLERMLPQFKRIAEKKGAERARGGLMSINPHSDMPRSWKSRYRVQESFKKSAVIDTELTRATQLYRENRLDEAVKSMETAVQADPESPTLLYDLGVMQMENGNYSEAIECFQRSLDGIKATGHTRINLIIHPKVYLGNCVNLGLAYMQLNMYEEAVKILKEAIKFKADDLDANWNLGITYWFMGDMDEAAAQIRKYINYDPNNAEAHNTIGLTYYCKELYNAALDEFQIAAKLAPDEKQYSYNEALVLARLDRYDEALEALKRSSGLEGSEYLRQVYGELIPANKAKKLYNDGCAAMEDFDSAKAIDRFNAALELKPDMIKAHMNLGVLYRMRGDKSKEVHHFEEAARLRPESPNVRYNLGLAYSDAGMYSEATVELEQAVKLNPSLRDAHFKLGTVLCKGRDFTDAIPKFEKCVELSPKWSKARLNLGTCYLKTGNVNGAIEQFEEVVQLRPNSAEANYNLGNAYMRVKKFDEASALFQKALKINPGYRQARAMLEEIQAYQKAGG